MYYRWYVYNSFTNQDANVHPVQYSIDVEMLRSMLRPVLQADCCMPTVHVFEYVFFLLSGADYVGRLRRLRR